jgi:hypothetical protein
MCSVLYRALPDNPQPNVFERNSPEYRTSVASLLDMRALCSHIARGSYCDEKWNVNKVFGPRAAGP